MSDLTVERAGRGGVAGLLTQPVRLPLWWRWPAAFALALLTLPRGVAGPGSGADASWGAGLALAQDQGLHFGRDIVFTYGPLGFLTTSSVYIVWQSIVAMVLAFVLQILLCRTLLHVSRALPVAVSVVVACIVASIPTIEGEIGLAIVLALAFSVLADDTPVPRWAAAAGGAAAAVLTLLIPSLGIQALAVVALVALVRGSGPLRSLGELLASFCVVALGLWIATGNALGDILPWLRATAQFVSGYTAAMALDDPARHGETIRGILLFGIVSLLVVRLGAHLSHRRRAALVLVWAIVGFGALKEGFVRHDAHAGIYFGMAAVAALSVARGRRLRFAAAGVAVVASAWSFAAVGVGIAGMLDFPTRGNALVGSVRLLASPDRLDAVVDEGRRSILRPLKLPPPVVRDLRAHTVDVQPTETSTAWALGVRWRPEPDFQTYAVLTPALDRLNADFLASSRAPERILRVYAMEGIDGRNPAFDAPEAFLATICNYRERFVSKTAEVFERATNRCGTPRALASVDVRSGTLVHVPQAGVNELVYARIHISRSPAERLRELLWKPARNPGIDIGTRDFRLVAATASGPLVMQVPRVARMASNSLAVPHARVFRLVRVSGPVHVDFYAVRIGAAR